MTFIITSKSPPLEKPQRVVRPDYSHHFSRGLVWSPHLVPANNFRDIIGQNDPVRTVTGDVTLDHNGADNSGVNGWYLTYPTPSLTAIDDFTLTASATPDNLSVRNALISSATLYELAFMGHQSDADGSFCYLDSPSFYPGTTTKIFTNDEQHTYCVTRVGTLVSWYVDGVFITSTTANSTAATLDVSAGMRVSGPGTGSGVSRWIGTIHTAHMHIRALSAAEIRDHHANPYAHLIGQPRRTYFIPSAGGGGSFQSAWARGSNVVIQGSQA